MAKYLLQGAYTADGLKGLQKDKASGRRDALARACQSEGGKLDVLYYAFGADDFVAILDLPDNGAAWSLSLTIAESGVVRGRTTPLMTIEEMDTALAKNAEYRAPGR
jgi:uncharacterized protein with GYD domain